VHGDGKIGILVINSHKQWASLYIDAQFLVYFTHQRLMVRFTSLYLATGKLPFFGQFTACLALCAENQAVPLYDCRYNFKVEVEV
jgi:hypothetical protein